MSRSAPDQLWWTTRELAEAGLPDLPASQQGVDALVRRNGWRIHPDLARRRAGRGGGWEYHWSLLPIAAKNRLLARADGPGRAAPERLGRDEAWAQFEALPEATRAKAQRRLDALVAVEAMVAAGVSKHAAIGEIAIFEGVSDKTIWNWFALVDGVRDDDRLPYLAPRHRAARKAGSHVDCSEEWWAFLKSDFLRPERPSFSSCYRRAERVAAENGWQVLPERTARRRFDKDVPETTQIMCREGVDALKRMYPAQTRDRTALYALEAVNADYHRFDVFVRWPDGGGEVEIVRPQLIAFQDIYSGRILSWRLDRTPNRVGVSLALGDMIERFGIPEHVLLDNGREFANKFLTGQVPTRYRFKVKDDDIPGILKLLGCSVHWATPYSGQSKPIERAFRDLCDSIAKDPRLAGAYTGNRPDAKPENYGNRAIDLEDFIALVEEGIEEHNTRPGRRGQTTAGRSLLATFEDSYAVAPIRKATPEQRRLWLMGAEGVKCDSRTGLIRLMGNEYWSAFLHAHRGQKVVARFDPADLRAGLHVYALNGTYLGLAECKVAGGFFDLEEARDHAAARRKWVKAEKAAAEAHRKLKIAEIGDHLDNTRPGPGLTDPVEARVVRPVFTPRKPAVQTPVETPEQKQERAAFVADFSSRAAEKTPRPAQRGDEMDERALFRRALELEARIAADEAVSDADERWLKSYQTTPGYAAQRAIHQRFGRDSFG